VTTPPKPPVDPVRWQPAWRKLLWKLPDRLQPQIKPEAWAVAFDPDTGAVVAGVHTEHPSFGAVTGLVEAGGRLWMGRIGAVAMAHCELSALTV